MELLRKYNTATDLYFPLIKASSLNFAVSGDYTHAAGDVKISKDGGAAATATNAPTAITMGNGAIWKLTLTATEMQAAKIVVTIIDAATKTIEDQAILIGTYGNASGEHAFDLDVATQDVNVASVTTAAIGAGAIATDAIGAAELAADAVAEIADAVWDELTSGHIAAGSFGLGVAPLRGAIAQTGAAGTITLDASASAVDDTFTGDMIAIISGTGAGQSRLITSYIGSSKVANITPVWVTSPSSSSVFVILPQSYIASALALATGSIIAASFASGAIDSTAIATDAIGSAELAASAVTEIVQGIWNALTSGLTTGSSIGKLLVDNIDATVSSRASQTSVDTIDDFIDTEMAAVLAAVDTEVGAIKAKTDNLPAAPAAVGDIPTAAVIADAVLDDAMTEPAGVFAWGTATPRKIFAWLGALSRNKMTQTATTSVLRNDADSGDLAAATISDDGTTFTKEEWV